jgi:hypothetical protein
MKIIDLNGQEIEVTDLALAIMQADDNCHYRHSDPAFAIHDERLNKYWEDFYQKLLLLQEGLTG